MNKAEWEQGVWHETWFWQTWVDSQGSQWPEEYAKRIDPTLPLQGGLRECLDARQAEFDILDVGAGPLTWVGKVWEGHLVRITAVDPLATRYSEMLEKAHVTPLVRTQPGEVEALADIFAPGSFFRITRFS